MARVIALVAVVMGLLLGGSPASAGEFLVEVTPTFYTYEPPHYDAPGGGIELERGSSGAAVALTACGAVDPGSRHSLARSEAPATPSTFTYAGNNPVVDTDASGLRLACASGGARDQDACFYGTTGIELDPVMTSPLGGGGNENYTRGGNAPQRGSTWAEDTAAAQTRRLKNPGYQRWYNFVSGAFNPTIEAFGGQAEPIVGDYDTQRWWSYGGTLVGLGLQAAVMLPEDLAIAGVAAVAKGSAYAGERILATVGPRQAASVATNSASEVATVIPRVVHGNSASSPATAYLYRLSSAETGYLKTGISQSPMTRYSQPFMQDKTMEILQSGTRREMLKLERFIVERDPGPLNSERWAGQFAGDVP